MYSDWTVNDNRSHKAPLVVRRQAEPFGDYISVQKDHTLSGCSCTFRSVSEALAEPACRVQVRLPLFTCLRGSYGHTSGLNASDQSVSGGFRDVGSVISFELIAVRVDCSRFVPVRALQLQAATC